MLSRLKLWEEGSHTGEIDSSAHVVDAPSHRGARQHLRPPDIGRFGDMSYSEGQKVRMFTAPGS